MAELADALDSKSSGLTAVPVRVRQRHSKVRFTKDNFIDSIDFAYMEVQVIEED